MKTTLAHLLTPHHTNNYRARILHPAGLTVLVALFLISQVWVKLFTLAPSLPGGFVLGYASSITVSQTVDLTNSERAKSGLPPLAMSSALSQAAAAKANHMFANDYWAHIAPDGTTPWVFIKNSGYSYAVAGENLARDFDTTGGMIGAWMDSPTHKDNIVNNKYSEIGIAVVNGTLEGVETTLVVQMFGKPSVAVAKTSDAGIVDQANAAESAQEIAPTSPPTSPNPTEAPVLVAQVEQLPPPTQIEFDEAAALGTTLTAPSSRAYGNVIMSPMIITKAISASIVIMIIGVLMYDLLYMKKKKLPRKVGKNWAHVTILVFVLMFVLMAAQGKVI